MAGSAVLVGCFLGCGLVSRSAMLPCPPPPSWRPVCESLIGAIAQDRFALLTNEVANFINTLIATLAIALSGDGRVMAVGELAPLFLSLFSSRGFS